MLMESESCQQRREIPLGMANTEAHTHLQAFLHEPNLLKLLDKLQESLFDVAYLREGNNNHYRKA